LKVELIKFKKKYDGIHGREAQIWATKKRLLRGESKKQGRHGLSDTTAIAHEKQRGNERKKNQNRKATSQQAYRSCNLARKKGENDGTQKHRDKSQTGNIGETYHPDSKTAIERKTTGWCG